MLPTNPLKICIYIQFWRMACQYQTYYVELRSAKGVTFMSGVQLISIIDAVLWEVIGVLDVVQACR